MRKKQNLDSSNLLRLFIRESVLIKEGTVDVDTDGDGTYDAVETAMGTDPNDAKSFPTQEQQKEVQTELWKAVFGDGIPEPDPDVVKDYIGHATAVGQNSTRLTSAAEYITKVFSTLSAPTGTQKIAQKLFVDESDLNQMVKDLEEFKNLDAKFNTHAPLISIALAMGIATADWPWIASPAVTKESLSRRSYRLLEGLERFGLAVAELVPVFDDIIRTALKDVVEASGTTVDDIERLAASGEARIPVDPKTLSASGTRVTLRTIVESQVEKGILEMDLAANEKLRKALSDTVRKNLSDPDMQFENIDDIMRNVDQAINEAQNLAGAKSKLGALKNAVVDESFDEVISALRAVAEDRVEKVFVDPKVAKSMASTTLQRGGQRLGSVLPSRAALSSAAQAAKGALWNSRYSIGGLFRRYKSKGIFKIVTDAALASLVGGSAYAAIALITLYLNDPDISQELFSDPDASTAASVLDVESKYCFGNPVGKANLIKGCKIISYTLKKTIAESKASMAGAESDEEKGKIEANIKSAASLISFFDAIRTNVQNGTPINYNDLV